MLSPLAIAQLGVGHGPLLTAALGLLPVEQTVTPPSVTGGNAQAIWRARPDKSTLPPQRLPVTYFDRGTLHAVAGDETGVRFAPIVRHEQFAVTLGAAVVDASGIVFKSPRRARQLRAQRIVKLDL